MDAARSFLIAILQQFFFRGIISADDSGGRYDPTSSNKFHTSKSATIAGYIFLRNSTELENGIKRECPNSSASTTSLTLCCNPEEVLLSGWNCTKENYTSSMILPTNKTRTSIENENEEKLERREYVYPLIDDPCRFDWMAPSVFEDFEVMDDGSIHVPDYEEGSLSDCEHYCIFRRSKSPEFSVKVCREWVRKDWWDILGLVAAILVMLATFIGYNGLPENRNLHGLIFRSYIATYIATYLCALAAEFTTQLETYPILFTLSDIATRYCGCSCASWLNVMSFNIWRSFRWLRPIDHNTNKFERTIYALYAIYAWTSPAIGIGFWIIIFETISDFRNTVLRHNFKNLGSAAVIVGIYVCNLFLFISTAIRIRQHKIDIANLKNGVNKHHGVDKRWFNLYLKLFFIMGGHVIIWSIWLVWPTPKTTHLFAAAEVVQSILIFIIYFETRTASTTRFAREFAQRFVRRFDI